MTMDLSSKDWAGVTNEEILGHEERSPWPEACVNLTLTQLQPLKHTTEIKNKPPLSLSTCNTSKCCLQLLLTAGKCQRCGRTRSSPGFVVPHPCFPHPEQSRRHRGDSKQEEEGRGAERRQQLDGTVNMESFSEPLDSHTDFSRQGRIQDLLQQDHESAVRAAVRD